MPVTLISDLDERSWNAISVEAAPIEATIIGAYIHDVTTNTGYVESDQSNRHPFPITLPLGHVIYGNISTKNTGLAPVRMRVLIELIDPDGIVRHSIWTSFNTVNPGVSMASAQVPQTTLNKLGTWILHGVIEGEPA